MGRIMGIDYGGKRSGISVTDPLQIIVTGLTTVDTKNLFQEIENYLSVNDVEKIVFGWPTHADGNPTYVAKEITSFSEKIKQKFPNVIIDFIDESFSSQQAKEIIMNSAYTKKKRQDKALVDKVSAIILLQKYLNHI